MGFDSLRRRQPMPCGVRITIQTRFRRDAPALAVAFIVNRQGIEACCSKRSDAVQIVGEVASVSMEIENRSHRFSGPRNEPTSDCRTRLDLDVHVLMSKTG